MKKNTIVGIVCVVALLLVGIKLNAVPNPLNKPPSFLKFNSVTVKGSTEATAGQALLADGNAGSVWGNVAGVHVASNVSGSPALNGTVLTADGTGKATWEVPGPSVPLPGSNNYIQNQSATAQLADFNITGTGVFGGNIGVGTQNPQGRAHVMSVPIRTGTGTILSAGTTIIGSGTSFTAQLSVGDFVTAAGQTQTVSGISNDIQLMTSTAFNPVLPIGTAFTYTKVFDAANSLSAAIVATNGSAPAILVNSSGTAPAAVFATGNVGIGTANPGSALTVAGTIESSSGGIKFPDGTVQTTAWNTAIYGDGSDGTVIISTPTTLTRDMFYDSLTVNGTGVLNAAGFRIFVKGNLTVDSSGGATIKNNGGDGGNGGNGITLGAPGAGGTAGAASGTGTMPGGMAGTAGGGGGNGGGVSGVPGTAGLNSTYAINSATGATGGAGGIPGGGGSAGGAGGTNLNAISNTPRTFFSAYYLFDFTSRTAIQQMAVNVGAGSGGGGTGGFGGSTDGGGGGSGGGGGIVFIAATNISLIGTGCIQANGGNGGTGGNDGNGGGGGGGGGGNGGVIFLIYNNKTGTGTAQALGGIGGTGGTATGVGLNGGNGANGLVIAITGR